MARLKEEKIQELTRKNRMPLKKHTVLRMRLRGIPSDEVKEALQHCKVIEIYPNDYPLPSGLVVGYTKAKRPIHAVVVIDEEDENEEMAWIITVYEPNTSEWMDGFEMRRKK